jgi:hypothetical protein
MLQRRLVWKLPQKSALVESVLLDYPIPEIFVQQNTTAEGDSSFVVVDGQQRIAAILAFLGIKDDDPDNGFELQHLPTVSKFRNLSWDDLTEDQKKAFYAHRFSARILEETSDEDLRDLFRRLNKNLTKLSEQELRNATYSGALIRIAEELSDSDYWATNRIVTPEDIRRMRDIEYVSELIVGVMHGPQGGSPKSIDDFYAQYEEFQEELPDEPDVRRHFSRTLEAVQTILPDIRETRWRNKTDFYSLFVALAYLLKDFRLPEDKVEGLQGALDEFAARVAEKIKNKKRKVLAVVSSYVEAVEKGVSDKHRRADRHDSLITLISPFLVKRSSAS